MVRCGLESICRIRALDAVAARSPVTLDRYMDFLRAFSKGAVVMDHWTIGLIWWENGHKAR